MNITLPQAAVLAWWGTAWLRGHVVSDLFLDSVTQDGSVHTVRTGLPDLSWLPHDGSDEIGPGLLDLMTHLRRSGASQLGLALPLDGDPLGLAGPPAFNMASLEAGQAVIASQLDLGAVPEVVGAGVAWTVQPALRPHVPDVGESDRGLRSAILETGRALVSLDVAGWRPELADAMMDLRRPARVVAPPGTPDRCVDLAARALQCWAIVDLAVEDEGGAITAEEMRLREAALRPLDRAARRGLVAACSPDVWPAD